MKKALFYSFLGIFIATAAVTLLGIIAGWIAFKGILKWKDDTHAPTKDAGGSIYIIGTVLSLAFGVFGGMIATGKFTLKP